MFLQEKYKEKYKKQKEIWIKESGRPFKCVKCGKVFRKQYIKRSNGIWELVDGSKRYCSNECYEKDKETKKLARWESEKAPLLQKKLDLYESFLDEFGDEFFESYRNKIEDILDKQLKILENKFIVSLNQIIKRTHISKRINFNIKDIEKSNSEDIDKQLEENNFIKKDKDTSIKLRNKTVKIRKLYDLSLEQYRKLTSKCAICGFDKIVDLHHITSRKDGGNNDLNNLVGLCPTHHYMIHRLGYSFEDLKKEMLSKDSVEITCSEKCSC